eukprot:2786014-Ditylum_brightwellii.AAC.2
MAEKQNQEYKQLKPASETTLQGGTNLTALPILIPTQVSLNHAMAEASETGRRTRTVDLGIKETQISLIQSFRFSCIM